MAASTDTVERLRGIIASSENCVIFTGAGISTESGIPDFRSPGGIWSKVKPIQFSDFMASEEMRREYWQRKFEFDRDMQSAVPNQGHLAVAKLVQQGKVPLVITQNVDGLHQASGIADEQIIELHGNTTYATCLDCSKRFELTPIRIAFETSGAMPLCDLCGGIVKNATISFGQAMPVVEMRRAESATLACDLFIAIGSSLVVYPAAGFPEMAKRNGSRLVIINRDPTPMDQKADLVLHTEIGPTLSSIIAVD